MWKIWSSVLIWLHFAEKFSVVPNPYSDQVGVVLYRCLVILMSSCRQLSAPLRYASTRPSTAFHLEEDISDPSKLLAAYVGSIGSIGAGDRAPNYIAGSGNAGYQDGRAAMFDEITGFAQVSGNIVLIADHGNNCIRKVDRQQGLTSTAAGKCGDTGWRDGSLGNSRFSQPYNIIKSFTGNNTFFVTDHNNHAIREINLDSGNVSTFLKDEDNLYFPIAMVIDNTHYKMFVTMRYSVVSIGLDSKRIQKLSDNRGDKIALMRPGVIIITDNPRDYYLRNRKRSVITQIDTTSGNVTSRDVLLWPHENQYPRSLFYNLTENTLYISERDIIVSLEVTCKYFQIIRKMVAAATTQSPIAITS